MIVKNPRGAVDDVGVEDAVVVDVLGAVGKNESAAGVDGFSLHLTHHRRRFRFGVDGRQGDRK